MTCVWLIHVTCANSDSSGAPHVHIEKSHIELKNLERLLADAFFLAILGGVYNLSHRTY